MSGGEMCENRGLRPYGSAQGNSHLPNGNTRWHRERVPSRKSWLPLRFPGLVRAVDVRGWVSPARSRVHVSYGRMWVVTEAATSSISIEEIEAGVWIDVNGRPIEIG